MNVHQVRWMYAKLNRFECIASTRSWRHFVCTRAHMRSKKNVIKSNVYSQPQCGSGGSGGFREGSIVGSFWSGPLASIIYASLLLFDKRTLLLLSVILNKKLIWQQNVGHNPSFIVQ